jgi:CubicO group peptidase (beta-lactamase class C family)
MVREYWPGADWETAEPAEVGLDGDRLAAMDEYARDSMPPIRGIVVVRRGRIAFERYYDGCTAETYHTVNSVTKSVISALIGIALRKGLLTGVEQSLHDFFPELARAGGDARKQGLTLRHLLTMTSGFATGGLLLPLHQEMPPDAPDLVSLAFERPLAAAPGERFNYDNLSSHLVSVALGRLTGMSTSAFAEQELFGPLGIWASGDVRFVWKADRGVRDSYHFFGQWPDDGWPWKVDQHGHAIGALGLHLTLREMARFGYLYLRSGCWNGDEIVPGPFLEESTQTQNPGGSRVLPGDCSYGYLWWVSTGGAYFGLGYGGQYLFVLPRQDLVIAVATMPPINTPSGLLPRFIRPAVLD